MIAQRSERRELLDILWIEPFHEKFCTNGLALIMIGVLVMSSPNNHESELEGIPYKQKRRRRAMFIEMEISENNIASRETPGFLSKRRRN